MIQTQQYLIIFNQIISNLSEKGLYIIFENADIEGYSMQAIETLQRLPMIQKITVNYL